MHFPLGYAISLPSSKGFNFRHSIVVAAYFKTNANIPNLNTQLDIIYGPLLHNSANLKH